MAPAEEFLRSHGAGSIEHPGGTLLAHLQRVARVLDGWGADPDVAAAGLCHATYGTDGFGSSLLAVTQREELAALIGERAEALVYLYASCDRGYVYPQLGSGRVVFRDRFTGRSSVPADPELCAFMEITAANELDVLAHNADLAARYGADLHALFTRSRELLSAPAWAAVGQLAGGFGPGGEPEGEPGVE
ncbi:MAG TPA: hypothetical protein VGD70_17085 [Actinophytocola sp.]|jgi:hypothetical protein